MLILKRRHAIRSFQICFASQTCQIFLLKRQHKHHIKRFIKIGINWHFMWENTTKVQYFVFIFIAGLTLFSCPQGSIAVLIHLVQIPLHEKFVLCNFRLLKRKRYKYDQWPFWNHQVPFPDSKYLTNFPFFLIIQEMKTI